MNVREIMHAGADVESPDTTLADVARRMRDRDIGAVPIGENDRLVGMITDRDIVLRGVADGRDVSTTTVRDIMTDTTVWCYETADVTEAAELMQRNRVRRLPVINGDKRLVGMVTVGDLTAASPELAGGTLRELSAVAG